eukprot:TRINITY_DN613_c0_g1_i1.p1 TRINITY_DN613_c0_g1~~TRINITY_DN613_c0_g1_i1.p1  ORF type:complete len:121 (-),score=10.10 TRINITY_DN613_c0_g1_i1:224-586(-)
MKSTVSNIQQTFRKSNMHSRKKILKPTKIYITIHVVENPSGKNLRIVKSQRVNKKLLPQKIKEKSLEIGNDNTWLPCPKAPFNSSQYLMDIKNLSPQSDNLINNMITEYSVNQYGSLTTH